MLQLRSTFSCRGGRIIGRSVVDIRVCASTGRDRDNDEQKLSVTSSDTAPVEGSDTSKRPKKRPALTQNLNAPYQLKYLDQVSLRNNLSLLKLVLILIMKQLQLQPKVPISQWLNVELDDFNINNVFSLFCIYSNPIIGTMQISINVLMIIYIGLHCLITVTINVFTLLVDLLGSVLILL